MHTMTLDQETQKALQEAVETILAGQQFGWIGNKTPERTVAIKAIRAFSEAIVNHGAMEYEELLNLKIRIDAPNADELAVERLLRGEA
jgi:hypothetical protein